MNNILPEEFKKYFWDCDFEDLLWEEYPVFISERILKFGDFPDLKWLLSRVDNNFILNLANTSRNLDERTSNYWKVMLNE